MHMHFMQNAGLDDWQAEIKFAERAISNLRYVDDTTRMSESKEKLKNLLMMQKTRVKNLA